MTDSLKKSKSSIVSVLLVGVYLLFYVNWAWGIYWSFHRHGSGTGLASIFIPPVAWYRGVASFWETPIWKERYTEEVSIIAQLALSRRQTEPGKIAELSSVIADRRRYIATLPPKVASELRLAFTALPDAYSAYQLRNTCALFDLADDLRKAEASLKSAETRISSSPELSAEWIEYKRQDKHSLDLAMAKNDLAQLVRDSESRIAAAKTIYSGTEASWGELLKTCLDMTIIKASEAPTFDHASWQALIEELRAPKKIEAAKSF